MFFSLKVRTNLTVRMLTPAVTGACQFAGPTGSRPSSKKSPLKLQPLGPSYAKVAEAVPGPPPVPLQPAPYL